MVELAAEVLKRHDSRELDDLRCSGKLLQELGKQCLIDVLIATGNALGVGKGEFLTRREMRAGRIVLKVGNLCCAQAFLHPTGRVNVQSEWAAVQARDQRIDQITQAR